MIDHAEILAELIQILTDETEDKTPKEIMEEIVSVIDDYKSELDLEENEKEQRDNLIAAGVDPDEEDSDEEDEDSVVNNPVTKQINRAFLLTKAKKEYYRKHGLSEEDEDEFTPTEKMKHRKGVTAVFNAMVIEEQNKKDTPSIYSNGPFKKIEGNVNVNRKVSEEDLEDEDDEEITPAQNKWKKSRMQEIKRNIRSVKSDIDELKRQNNIKKISASIINRNSERIAELEDELADLEEQKQQYE